MIIGKKIHENIRKIDLTLYKYIYIYIYTRKNFSKYKL